MKAILILTLLLSSATFASEFDDTMSLAIQGNAEAQRNLGWMYANGEGTPENDAEAVKWYRKAAEQGNAEAQRDLGVMYDDGEGTPEDDVEAVKWYRKAAEQGDTLAQGIISGKYFAGEGVPQSYIKAYVWSSMAKTQGLEQGARLTEIARDMILLFGPQNLIGAQSLATKCYESGYKDCD
jgi:TPR repeat protein